MERSMAKTKVDHAVPAQATESAEDPAVTVGRPFAVRLLVFLLAFEGIAGISGGLGFMVDPSGALYGLPPEWLEMLPIADYLLPGLFLLFVLGAYPAFTAWALWTEAPAPVLDRFERTTHMVWPWFAAVSIGVTLMAWIALGVVLLGVFAPIMAVWGVLGLAIVIIAFLPSVRGWARLD
jgi:hypothetical protein